MSRRSIDFSLCPGRSIDFSLCPRRSIDFSLCPRSTDMPDQSKPFYRRNLPHWHPPGAAIFLTYQLEGSLPRSARERLAATSSTLLEREAARADEDNDQRKARHNKKLFAMLDRMLDKAESGPLWLKDPRIADIVESALLHRYSDL